jgi:F-type H+-transporting ATPase subunit delta
LRLSAFAFKILLPLPETQMNSPKQIDQFAKKLLALSKKADGGIDAQKVSAVLSSLKRSKPRNLRQILQRYLALVKRTLRQRTAHIEHAGELQESAVAEIQSAFSSRYGVTLETATLANDDLIAGLRVRVGDDLYDASIRSRLDRLKALA